MSNRINTPLIAAAAGGAALWALGRRLRRHYDLDGKVAIVTGGSRGLGLLIARRLAARGARVAICARDEAELDRAKADLEARGAEVLALVCDLAEREQIDRFVEGVRGHFGRVDVVVNNAGVIQVGPMEVMSVEDYDHAMRVHFWAPLYLTLAVLPEMRERGEGRIVNISSIGGKLSIPHLLPYSASKFALTGLSEGLHAELAKDGILVTTICPGLMRTGSPRNAEFKGKHRAEYAWFAVCDSLPAASLAADRAARQIVTALERGDAEVVLSLPAQLAARFHGLFPAATAEVLGAVNTWLLPGPGGIGSESRAGRESESAVTRSPLTLLTKRAAARNNETEGAMPEAARG
jgi:NAD(P)-dependent dehydrogenase (short-subunit alcohol dehydrogenase family)